MSLGPVLYRTGLSKTRIRAEEALHPTNSRNIPRRGGIPHLPRQGPKRAQKLCHVPQTPPTRKEHQDSTPIPRSPRQSTCTHSRPPRILYRRRRKPKHLRRHSRSHMGKNEDTPCNLGQHADRVRQNTQTRLHTTPQSPQIANPCFPKTLKRPPKKLYSNQKQTIGHPTLILNETPLGLSTPRPSP